MLQKIMPKTIAMQAYLVTTVVVTVLMAVIGYMYANETRERIFLSQERKLTEIAIVLAQRLNSDGLLLRYEQAANATDEATRQAIRASLQPIVEEVGLQYPGFAMGYSLRDSRLAAYPYRPDFLALPMPSDAEDVLREKKPRISTDVKSMFWSETSMIMVYPVLKDGKIIASIWVNVPLTRVNSAVYQAWFEIVFILLVAWIFLMVVLKKAFTDISKTLADVADKIARQDDNIDIHKVPQLQSVVKAITALQKSLQEKETAYRTLVENSPDMIIRRDTKGKITYGNPVLTKHIQLNHSYLVGDSFLSRNEFILYMEELAKNVVATGNNVEIEYERHSICGETSYFKGTMVPERNESGQIVSVLTVSRDITDIKEANERTVATLRILQDREERLRILMEATTQAVWETDGQGMVITDSPSWRTYTGQSFEEYMGSGWLNAVHPEDREYAARKWREAVTAASRVDMEFRLRGPSGWHWTLIKAVPLYGAGGAIDKWVGMNIDISERKQLEMALRDSEAKHRTILENAIDGINSLDLATGKYVYMTPRQAELTGFSMEEINHISAEEAYERVHPEDRQVSVEQQKQLAAGSDKVIDATYRWKVKSGEYRWFSDRRKLIRDIDGQPKALVGFSRDITELKQAEQALREAKEMFEKVFHNGLALMSIVRIADDNVLAINKHTLDMLGYEKDEILNRPLWDNDLISTEDYERIQAVIKEMTEEGRAETQEYVLKAKSGNRIPILTSAVTAFINGELCIINIGLDISKQKEMEAAIHRLDKLNLVGEMAASIGHEVRNPMTTVRGYLQLFQRKAEFQPYNDRLITMIEEIDRANTIITEFLSLAKNKIIHKEAGNLNTVIETMFPLMQADALRMGQQLEVNCSAIPDTIFDESEIRQLILNLFRNAMDAMDLFGVARIRTFATDDDVVLEVSDTGKGIPPEIMEKLGTPFFTTKENGTGLGLAVCYRVAQHHDAIIHIDSSPAGTTFSIHFKTVKAA